jgi:hypothetical protein
MGINDGNIVEILANVHELKIFRTFVICNQIKIKEMLHNIHSNIRLLPLLAGVVLLSVSCRQNRERHENDEQQKVVPEIFGQFYSIRLSPSKKGYKPLTIFFKDDEYAKKTYVRYIDKNDKYMDEIPLQYSHSETTFVHTYHEVEEYYFNEIIDGKINGKYRFNTDVQDILESISYIDTDGKEYGYNVHSYTLGEKRKRRLAMWDNYEWAEDSLDIREERTKNIPQSVSKFIPSDYTVLDIVYGNLNFDKFQDAIMVLKNKKEDTRLAQDLDSNEKRPLLLLIGQPDNTYKQVKRSDNTVIGYVSGIADNSYQGITIGNGIFYIDYSYAGGYTETVTIRYSKSEDNWFLYSLDQSFPRNETNADVTEIYVEKIPFERFKLYKPEDYE